MLSTKLNIEILFLEPKLPTGKNVIKSELYPEKWTKEAAASKIAQRLIDI